jgi:hypothetical protein
MTVMATALPNSNAWYPGRNILDRIEFDAYSSFGNLRPIHDPVDKSIWMALRISLKFKEYDSKPTSTLYLDVQK